MTFVAKVAQLRRRDLVTDASRWMNLAGSLLMQGPALQRGMEQSYMHNSSVCSMAQQDGGVAVLGRGWKQTRDLASLSQVSVVRAAAEEHDERESGRHTNTPTLPSRARSPRRGRRIESLKSEQKARNSCKLSDAYFIA